MDNEKTEFKRVFTQRLIKFSLMVIKICNRIRNDRNLVALADQLIRSATSIGANVIEAKASSSKREYIHYFEIALKSAYETHYWLILIRESQPETSANLASIINEVDEIGKVLNSSILTLKGKK